MLWTLLSKASTIIFCCIISNAKLTETKWAGGHIKVGPKTMAKFGICIRFFSLNWVTLTRCLSRAHKVVRWGVGIDATQSFICFIFCFLLWWLAASRSFPTISQGINGSFNSLKKKENYCAIFFKIRVCNIIVVFLDQKWWLITFWPNLTIYE